MVKPTLSILHKQIGKVAYIIMEHRFENNGSCPSMPMTKIGLYDNSNIRELSLQQPWYKHGMVLGINM